MVNGVGVYMKMVDIIAFIGISFISIGFFKLNIISGFIATGSLMVGVAFLISREGD